MPFPLQFQNKSNWNWRLIPPVRAGRGVLSPTFPCTQCSPCNLPITTVRSSMDVAQRRWSFSQFCSRDSLNLVLIHLPRRDLPVETNGPWPLHPESETCPRSFSDGLQAFKRNIMGNIKVKHIPHCPKQGSGQLRGCRMFETILASEFSVQSR